MKKMSLMLAMILLFVLMSTTLTGCRTKYCSVSGCPSERSSLGSVYCTKHKCANTRCKNRGSLPDAFSYCEECIRRAN